VRLSENPLDLSEFDLQIGGRRPRPPMTLGNMRELGVQHLIAYCHNDACRDQAVIDVFGYPDDVEVTSFQRRAKCSKCGRQVG
jgi:hypothetical protein